MSRNRNDHGPCSQPIHLRVQKYIRETFLCGLSDQLFDTTDNKFVIPKHVRLPTQVKKWKEYLNKLCGSYFKTRRRIVVIKYLNDAIGLGVIATKNIKSGVRIHEISSGTSKRLSVATASRHLSSIETNQGSINRYYILTGTIAFVNHSCQHHANCVTCNHVDDDPEGAEDWKFLKSSSDIKAGEELTVCYSNECDLICRLCAKLIDN